MSKNISEKEKIEEINKQIEDELRQYGGEKNQINKKKEFMTLKFFATFIILIMMIFSLVKLFI